MTKHSGRVTILLATAAIVPAVMTTPVAAEEIEPKDDSASTTPPIVLPLTATGPFKKGTLGISVAVPGAAPSYVVNFTYFVSDKAALDLIGGFTLARLPADATTMPPTEAATVFGFTAGLGYRMYKRVATNLHSYIEPYGLLSSPDVGSIGDNLAIQLGGNFGVECMLTEWFSFRGQLGGAVQFVGGADNVQLATTTGLFGSVYWK